MKSADPEKGRRIHAEILRLQKLSIVNSNAQSFIAAYMAFERKLVNRPNTSSEIERASCPAALDKLTRIYSKSV